MTAPFPRRAAEEGATVGGPQLTVIGWPPETRRQSTEANWSGSIVPCSVTQSMSS